MALIGIAALALSEKIAKAQAISPREVLQRYGFVDENGDGINDLTRDADNDGIPNCQDPDWVRPQDGSGYANRHGHKRQNGVVQNRRQGGARHSEFRYLWNRHLGDGTGMCDRTSLKGRLGRRAISGNSR
jgi:hypothetical protein